MISQDQNITIQKAEKSQIQWINDVYQQIGFIASNYDTEYIAIANKGTVACGLGRITHIDQENLELGGMYVFEEFRGMGIANEIVKHLLTQSDQTKKIWCLPFSHLANFYWQFGFKNHEEYNFEIPKKVLSKYKWCNDTYNDKVLLLVK
ncbi:GNAT family N-acetyltransferase [Aquimarina gracilis]|uniref:GNAT family N-acetyltransferase n=1 Tax=Aquimarina gracilis TaxID=874422 RepID=A0ABU5ZXT8_9FLAO|nr:GNAT family N-acetyltransferase [Aquimarina gracilis]MEB3346676.1 GNAT family N-acetyltransferase [Aquimarina gracilis]